MSGRCFVWMDASQPYNLIWYLAAMPGAVGCRYPWQCPPPRPLWGVCGGAHPRAPVTSFTTKARSSLIRDWNHCCDIVKSERFSQWFQPFSSGHALSLSFPNGPKPGPRTNDNGRNSLYQLSCHPFALILKPFGAPKAYVHLPKTVGEERVGISSRPPADSPGDRSMFT